MMKRTNCDIAVIAVIILIFVLVALLAAIAVYIRYGPGLFPEIPEGDRDAGASVYIISLLMLIPSLIVWLCIFVFAGSALLFAAFGAGMIYAYVKKKTTVLFIEMIILAVFSASFAYSCIRAGLLTVQNAGTFDGALDGLAVITFIASAVTVAISILSTICAVRLNKKTSPTYNQTGNMQ